MDSRRHLLEIDYLRHGDSAFFIMDTRMHRSPGGSEDGIPQTLLGDAQLTALHTWLIEVCLSLSYPARWNNHCFSYRQTIQQYTNSLYRLSLSPRCGSMMPRQIHGLPFPMRKSGSCSYSILYRIFLFFLVIVMSLQRSSLMGHMTGPISCGRSRQAH